jgi:hypothetical protein
MRFALPVLAAISLFQPAVAAPGFSGRWIADLASQKLPDHPDVYLVKGGQYLCRSCSPPRSYPADGKPHAVPGDPEISSEAVTILGPRSIRTRIVAPSLVRETVMTVAADDRTATYVSLDRRPGVSGVLRTRYLARRVAAAPRGANKVSGSWQGVAYLEVPRQVRTIELQIAAGHFAYRTPTGVSYSAVIGGGRARVHGPYKGVMTAEVRRAGANMLVETRRQDGRLLFERRFRLSGDGRSLEISTRDAATGTTFAATSHRG